jgi:Fe-S-cluster-containing dehydrogenase component/CRP-like cAMP-binding protein
VQDFSAVFSRYRNVELGPGELFGEIAAMYRTPQSATVIAEQEATLVEIRWQGLRLLRRDRWFAEQLEQHYRKHWLIPHLRETPLLRFVPEERLQRVAEATQLRSFGRMEWNIDFDRARRLPTAEQIEREPLIAIEGNLPTDLILIRAGFARVSQQHGAGHQTTAYLGKGHTFGFAELTHNATRPSGTPPLMLRHSLRSVGFVDTLHIPVEVFAEELLPHVRRDEIRATVPAAPRPGPEENIAAAIGEENREDGGPQTPSPAPAAPAERRRAHRDKPGDAAGEVIDEPIESVSTGLLEFLVGERLTNGREAMVIDLERCTRCDDCVRACATTHGGNPRMTRTGPTHDRLMFAQACMHCTDPVCMVGCPTGAIARDAVDGTVQISESICIGCGTCAAACPYENIRMVEIRDARGREYRDQASGLPIVKATKCDLCQSQPSGPACVNACPHDALARIDLGQLGPLDKWLGRQRG